MKNIIKALLSLLLLSGTVYGQNAPAKNDVIVKTNGDVINGEVKEVTPTTVKYVYAGEKVVYEIKKTELLKITFANGRVETFASAAAQKSDDPNRVSTPSTSTLNSASLAERRNKVAILPFSFVVDGQLATKEQRLKVQEECFSYLSKHAGIYNYQSPRTTAVLLTKAGISRENLLNFTMADLCEKLGVEFVLDGTVTLTKGSQVSSGYQSGSVKTTRDANKGSTEKRTSDYSSTSSTTIQNWSTNVIISIYNDQGSSIYNENRKPLIGQQIDSYKATMEYLLKRCPLYQK